MKLKQRAQQGFTLIELMIVVAIIGILAAIAIPQYQNYVTRTKWQDNISKVASTKLAIAECLQQKAGVLASCDTAAELTTAVGYPGVPTATGTLASASIGENAVISVVGTADVGGCTVTLSPSVTDTSVNWTAATTAAAGCSKATTGY